METVNYGHNKFYDTGPWGLYYKTIWIHNLQENDKFKGKLVYSGLDIQTSLDKAKQLLTTESVNYESIILVLALGVNPIKLLWSYFTHSLL
jgi:hypothetical protein